MSVEEEQQLVANENDNQQPTKGETPLPWNQLTPLLTVSLAESINFDLILPFLYQMVDRFDIAENPKDISFYASLLFTSFSLFEAITAMHWGRLSDRIGRKPVLIIGLTGTLISSLLLGAAPSFWVALFARSFNGLMAGNAAVVKSVISEISDDSNRPRAMAMLPLAWTFGTLVGAGVGGMLVDPAHQYPNLFSNMQIFVKFPYLLPYLVGSANTIFGLLSTMLKFKETLVEPSVATPEEAESDEKMPLLRESQSQPRQKSVKELLTPTVTKVVITNVITWLAISMYEQIYPIFAATPAIDGGLGFDSRSIGITMAVGGISVFYLQLVVYPRRAHKYGPLVCYQHGQKAMILYFLSMPFLSILASRIPDQQPTGSAEFYLLWVFLIALLLVRMVGQILTLTSMSLLAANIAPSKADLGAINGMQQLAFSSTRVFRPLISGILWSWSLKHDFPYPFNYYLAWVSCAAVIFLSLYMTYQLPESVNTFLADRERS